MGEKKKKRKTGLGIKKTLRRKAGMKKRKRRGQMEWEKSRKTIGIGKRRGREL